MMIELLIHCTLVLCAIAILVTFAILAYEGVNDDQ